MNLSLGIDTGGTYTDAVLVDHDAGEVLASAKALTTRHNLAIGIREAIAAVFDGKNNSTSLIPLTPFSPPSTSLRREHSGERSGQALAGERRGNNNSPLPSQGRACPFVALRASSELVEGRAGGVRFSPAYVTLVALSTTLATNTLAERQRGQVCLLLIGYDEGLMREFGFQRELATDDVVYVRGGHDERGNEVAALNEDALRQAILARRDRVEAFAVSGYFAVRNPGHELRTRALVEKLTGRPVTCGHELTSRLDAVRRATTVSLNAHLIAPLRELIASVQQTLAEQRIAAPLMVVKGDGSLVAAEWAMRRPVETILSGPAASVVGAWHLAGRRNPALNTERGHALDSGRGVWAVDVGGTTTDIGALRDGWPVLSPEGASVAGWRTMVEAVDVHTAGLGGDSHVRLDAEGRLLIGPRRAVPLCLLASEHPGVAAELRRPVLEDPRQGTGKPTTRGDAAIEFVTLGRPANGRLDEADREVLALLADGPQSLARLTSQGRTAGLMRRRIEELEAQGLVRRAGFTPTDALHVLGRFARWDVETARLAAAVLAGQAGLSVAAFCEQVVQGMAERVATELVSKVLADAGAAPEWERQPAARFMLRQALDDRDNSDLGCALTLRQPLVAIGAPVAAYLPQVAERLHTELVIPPHAEVANAVGAVAGGIIQRRHVLIHPLDEDGRLRLHLPDGVADFDRLDAAVEHAREVMLPLVEELARQAGAEQVVVRMVRRDQIAPIAGSVGGEVYLGTELTFTATGRPSPARRA